MIRYVTVCPTEWARGAVSPSMRSEHCPCTHGGQCRATIPRAGAAVVATSGGQGEPRGTAVGAPVRGDPLAHGAAGDQGAVPPHGARATAEARAATAPCEAMRASTPASTPGATVGTHSYDLRRAIEREELAGDAEAAGLLRRVLEWGPR